MTLLLITEKQLREAVTARILERPGLDSAPAEVAEILGAELARRIAPPLWEALRAAGAMQVGAAVPVEGWATSHGHQHYVRQNETLCGHHLTEGPAFGVLGEPERPGRCDICATALRRMASRGVHL